MTDRSPQLPQLPDAALERALAGRAPHGADVALLTEIVAVAAGTRQRRSWWPPFGSAHVGPRLTLAWVAIALAGALTVGALVAGGLRPDRPDLSVVVPPGPTGSPDPARPAPSVAPATPGPSSDRSAPPSPGSVVCSPDAIKVLTGDAMPPPSANSVSLRIKSGTGVFVTAGRGTADGRAVSGEVWAIHDGRQTTDRIATVTGDEIDSVAVEDVSADGTTALISVARPTVKFPLVGDDDVTCTEAYVVHVDGSGASRIVVSRWGFGLLSLSPDGRTVVYGRTTYDQVGQDGQVWDLMVGAVGAHGANGEKATTGCSSPTWSPSGARVAIACDGIVVLDPGSLAMIDVSPLSEHHDPGWETPGLIAWAWDDDSHLLLASAEQRDNPGPGFTGLAELHLDRADASSGKAEVVGHLGAMPWFFSTYDGQFSPDRRRVIFDARHPKPDWYHPEKKEYLVDRAGGVDKIIVLATTLDMDVAFLGQDVAWSTDSRAIVHVDPSSRTLLAMDVATRVDTELGILPDGYQLGIWHIQ